MWESDECGCREKPAGGAVLERGNGQAGQEWSRRAKFLTVLAGGYRHPDCTGEDLVRERI